MSEILFYKTQCSVFLNNETCMFWHILCLKSNDTRYKGQNLPFSHVYHKFNRPLNVAFLDIKVCFPLRRPHCPLESTSQQRHTRHHTPSDHCPSWGHLCTYQGRTQTVVENVHHLWCQAGLHLSTHPSCVAIDWIIQHMSFIPGITVGSSTFTDLVYTDDTA